MDSTGRMYQPGEALPADAIEIGSDKVALGLLGMNRKKRRAYYSERRRGATDEEAMGAAEMADDHG